VVAFGTADDLNVIVRVGQMPWHGSVGRLVGDFRIGRPTVQAVPAGGWAIDDRGPAAPQAAR